MAQEKVRVLVTVSGGVAEVFCNPNIVDARVVDLDNIEAGDECVLPHEFADLATEAGVDDEVTFDGETR